ncbi:MAG TPA: Gfo/Idh/MocA family oxidoreductase [Candidatus Hydrogenedens sp.]|nr:Gfo/Idh/MocA family oxidoreductase [Candidatus Hydrogenedens sp.]HOK08235.1 Gfo/Idh/MocA family oxidoreductase [Candidatus Hydrogenedens sp.]HOL20009.1 Gfo/Idh/MocA family oxidoreductase [Candidatus Hydrogenedens sp.]HPP59174.1 Gfo/Idh/MocA family oxidoreductase [Candidatus Hydrogenedens sp.]
MKVGIIGCGTMGRLHATMAKNCGLEVVQCADSVSRIAKDMAKEFKAKHVKNWEDLVQSKNVDIVVITTPTPYHYPILDLAIKKGKYIFCEKPLCRTTEECKKIVNKAEKKGVKLFVGHVVRYFHEFEAIQEQIKSGKIGDVGFVKMYRGGMSPKGWFSDFKLSGGVTFDCLIHDLDWLRYVFGEVKTVFCQNLIDKKCAPLDYSQITVRMKNGILALVIGTWAHPSGFRVKVEVCGSDGLIYYDNMENALELHQRQQGKISGTIVPESPVIKSPYQKEWEDFIDWIQNDKTPKVQPNDGLKAVEIVSACLRSAKTKQPISL